MGGSPNDEARRARLIYEITKAIPAKMEQNLIVKIETARIGRYLNVS
jgi:hypothetical protein